jgi:hypothetical protein
MPSGVEQVQQHEHAESQLCISTTWTIEDVFLHIFRLKTTGLQYMFWIDFLPYDVLSEEAYKEGDLYLS